jgi:hypothetical protein
MVQLIGSLTEKNLVTAFAGESQARNRYTYFAKQARNEGYVQIAQIFDRTADQEKEHAKRLFKFLQGGEAQVVASFRTWKRPRPGKTTSTRRCTLISPRSPRMKDSLKLPRPSPPSPWRKNSTKNSTWILLTISPAAGCSKGTIRSSGTAPTAAISMRAPNRPSNVRPAPIPRPISS